MSSTTAPERKNIIYIIPGSTLTLDIVLDEGKQLSASTITTLLNDANRRVYSFPQSGTVEGVFKWSAPDEEGRKAVFGIAGGPILNEMTWRDVSIILQGLKRWYEQEQKWVGLLFYVRDEKRGEMGDGYLEPVEEAAITTKFHSTSVE